MSTIASPQLQRLIAQSASPVAGEAEERCDLCGALVASEHRHVLECVAGTVLCACRPCSILFDHSEAGGGHYRLIPSTLKRLDPFHLDDLGWRALRIPVDMAYFVRRGDGGRMSAYYPSPAGPVESLLELDAWAEIERENADLAALAPDVEALLVTRANGANDAWIVGIDRCYRLVALMRAHWQGFTGGTAVWDAIGAFFEELRGGAAAARRERWT